MKKPEKTKNEGDRLKELEAYDILNAEQEGDFDFLTKMAAQICNTEISLISLVTEDRQLFLSHHGLEHKETCKEYSFCAHALHQPDKLFIIENNSSMKKCNKDKINQLLKSNSFLVEIYILYIQEINSANYGLQII